MCEILEVYPISGMFLYANCFVLWYIINNYNNVVCKNSSIYSMYSLIIIISIYNTSMYLNTVAIILLSWWWSKKEKKAVPSWPGWQVHNYKCQ